MVDGREPINLSEIENRDYEIVKAAFIQAVHTLDVAVIQQSLEGEFRQDISLMLLHAFRWIFANPNATTDHVRLLINYSQEKGESFRISVLDDAIEQASPDVIKIILSELVISGTQLPPKLLKKAKEKLGGEDYATIFLSVEVPEGLTEDEFISMIPSFENADQVRSTLDRLGPISDKIIQEVLHADNEIIIFAVFDYLVENGYDLHKHQAFVSYLLANGPDWYPQFFEELKENKDDQQM